MSNQKLLQDTLEKTMLVTPAKVQALINDLQQDGSSQATELATALKTLPQEMFAQKPGEQKMAEIVIFLEKRQLKPEQIQQITTGLAQATSEIALDRLAKSMSVPIKKEWDNVLAKGPNVHQQFIMLDYFCQASQQKSLENYFDEVLIETINNFTKSLADQQNLNQKYSALNEQDSQQVNTLIQTGQFEEALILMNK